MFLDRFFDNRTGIIIVSVIFGLGLASLFRKVCEDRDCIVIRGPNRTETDKFYYKNDSACYKYTPVVAECKDNDEDVIKTD